MLRYFSLSCINKRFYFTRKKETSKQPRLKPRLGPPTDFNFWPLSARNNQIFSKSLEIEYFVRTCPKNHFRNCYQMIITFGGGFELFKGAEPKIIRKLYRHGYPLLGFGARWIQIWCYFSDPRPFKQIPWSSQNNSSSNWGNKINVFVLNIDKPIEHHRCNGQIVNTSVYTWKKVNSRIGHEHYNVFKLTSNIFPRYSDMYRYVIVNVRRSLNSYRPSRNSFYKIARFYCFCMLAQNWKNFMESAYRRADLTWRKIYTTTISIIDVCQIFVRSTRSRSIPIDTELQKCNPIP